MTPTGSVADVILGVVANGVTALLVHGWRWLRPGEGIADQVSAILTKSGTFTTLIRNAALTTPHMAQPLLADRLKQLLASPEAESVIRQLFATQLTSPSPRELQALRERLRLAASIHLGIAPNETDGFADLLFDSLVSGSLITFEQETLKGHLGAHEALSAYRHRRVLDELAALQIHMQTLQRHGRPDISAILHFEQTYRTQVGERHAFIIPPDLDAARRVPIEKIYVAARFIGPKQEGAPSQKLRGEDLLQQASRLVVLGNPGGGKSTFALKVCRDLATNYSARLFGGRLATSILVVLKDYGRDKQEHHHSILQHIEATSSSKYQVAPPQGAFDYLLSSGRAAVIFDGLDELLETSARQEITSDVESFCNLYPSVPVLVTSREVGYEQAPLDDKKFDLVRLAPFDEEQVKSYVIKWFELDPDLTAADSKDRALRFLKESSSVTDLRSNPLMLGLMCNIYRGENYIPRNRPEVYEKCATLLFERWDRGRGIHVLLPFEDHISPAMKFLAYWIYSDTAHRTGVTERSLIAKVAEYLIERRFDDRDEAEGAARHFVEFCRGRAWVFTDTGTTAEGERLYQFTHQTFLEYFAAAHLTRIHPTPDLLAPILLERIKRREWDVVAQLAVQIQNKYVEGAGDALLNNVLTAASSGDDGTRWNLLLFAARCLDFLVPSPRIVKRVVRTCASRLLDEGALAYRRGNEVDSLGASADGGNVLGILTSAARENRPVVAGTIEELALERVDRDDESEVVVTLDLALHVETASALLVGADTQDEKRQFWRAFQENLADRLAPTLVTLAERVPRVAHEAFFRGLVNLDDVITWHGLNMLFEERRYLVLPNVSSWSIADLLGFWLIDGSTEGTRSNLDNALAPVGRSYDALPKLRKRQVGWGSLGYLLHKLREGGQQPLARGRLLLTGDSWFGAFCILATLVEMTRSPHNEGTLAGIFEGETANRIPAISKMMVDRIRNRTEAEQQIAAAPIDTVRRRIVRDWVGKKLDFYPRDMNSEEVVI